MRLSRSVRCGSSFAGPCLTATRQRPRPHLPAWRVVRTPRCGTQMPPGEWPRATLAIATCTRVRVLVCHSIGGGVIAAMCSRQTPTLCAHSSSDIKEAVFLGYDDALVACGSDDGRVFFYDADSGQPLLSIEADEDVANCVQVCCDTTHMPAGTTQCNPCRVTHICLCWQPVVLKTW